VDLIRPFVAEDVVGLKRMTNDRQLTGLLCWCAARCHAMALVLMLPSAALVPVGLSIVRH
jgi:hypothetical protein